MESEALETFQGYRSLLHGIAYRMIGSTAEAEDIVQETYLRWNSADTSRIRDPRAWLVTACSRLSIDRLKSAQLRREQYVGPWLPEPLLVSEDDPARQTDLDDSVSIALLYTLERLTPAERAAFLLHDVFDYPFEQIAEILGKTAQSCRKLASRARIHAQNHRPRFESDQEQHQRLTDSFFDAIKEGELERLTTLLSEDATLISDGGGKAIAAGKPVVGRDLVCTMLSRLRHQSQRNQERIQFSNTWYNGRPGVLIYINEELVSAYSFEVLAGRICKIFVHRNPDKLQIFTPTCKLLNQSN